ncbi:molybdate ABC transporter substrate-binding protein [Anaerococcus sp.]|uniref:molybdate ABC transporter substrate-binding protein n=1 Tax=Anaerococcus sp. TaxID=1872515 RepID=UPI002A911D5B|nr:molybdate ABC transporter substrate-binding protein [Anaerococcus sp.]MDY6126810.1 molybdate ABC transporter substrate-binding protein [Anaerococcus sp.]
MKVRKVLRGLFGLGLALGLVSCGSKDKPKEDMSKNAQRKDADKEELVVFAAASMTDVLDQIKTSYEKQNPEVNLIFNFDSSGTLKTQIEEGANCDVFISAAQKQMNELDPKSEDFKGKAAIKDKSRIDLLENKLCLVVGEKYDSKISKFEDLATDKVKTLALGNEDVPVGQYSKGILKNLGIYDQVMAKASLGSNVREVASWVSENTADAGIVYATDAKAFGLKVVAEAKGSMLENKIIYPAAILENSNNKEEAQKFLNFLLEDESGQIFEDAGFSVLR